MMMGGMLDSGSMARNISEVAEMKMREAEGIPVGSTKAHQYI